jgi:hypothetical protein
MKSFKDFESPVAIQEDLTLKKISTHEICLSDPAGDETHMIKMSHKTPKGLCDAIHDAIVQYCTRGK